MSLRRSYPHEEEEVKDLATRLIVLTCTQVTIVEFHVEG